MVGSRVLLGVLVVGSFACGEGAEGTCVNAGQQCDLNIDCCEGTCNTGGVCNSVNSCSDIGQACGDGEGCCEALVCNTATSTCEAFQPDSGAMSFFITSVGNTDQGGNMGGLEAADLKCQALINAAPVPDEVRNRTWHAYLSTTSNFTNGESDGSSLNARDRIGFGPWFNFDGVQIAPNLATLHASGIPGGLMLDENGGFVPQGEHVILTGSRSDGTAETQGDNDFLDFGFANAACGNWTSNNSFRNTFAGTATGAATSWNSGEHVFCNLGPTSNSSGRFYCFAE